MRYYQLAPVPTILYSIKNHLGLTIIIIFPRQSGKDELLVWLKVWLLRLFSFLNVGIVEFNPTYKPQTINALDRFDIALKTHILTRKRWRKRADFMRGIGLAKCSFLSGDKTANVVGATASLALFVNEAQDIAPQEFDKKQDPMTASTNATKIFAGTVWTSDTLLHREYLAAIKAQEEDGIRRVFMYDADDVAKVVPWYGAHVQEKVKKLGRQHPLVKTQYFNEVIDAQIGMFHAGRLALMQADQPAQSAPTAGHVYAFCIDVGGQDEAQLQLDGMGNPGRDHTTLSIIDVDLSTLPILQAPTYRTVFRKSWQGESHLHIFGQLKALADAWKPQHFVIDASGVGEGLWAMFAKWSPTRTIAIKFSAQKKSEIGWGYLAIIETGRYRDCAPNETVRLQYEKCQSEILPGPGKIIRWGVKDGTRGPDGLLVHDDFVLADSMTAALDELEWQIHAPTAEVAKRDYTKDAERNY